MKPKNCKRWEEGPPKWFYTAWGVVLATLHVALAGFGVEKFLELWDDAWQFYATLIGITSAAAVIIRATTNKSATVAAPESTAPWIPAKNRGSAEQKEKVEEDDALPSAPR